MSQYEKLPYIRPPSPVPEAGEGSTKLHRYFVVSTFAAYFTLDVVSKIHAVHRYGRSLSELLYLFYANVINAFIFAQYTMREKTPRYNRLLSYYFVAVGFLYPLAVGASILVESVQGNDPFMYFGRGYMGAQITYCSVRTYADFGYGPEHETEDYEKPRRFCWMLSTSSTIMVLYLAIGFGAVGWVAMIRKHGQTV
ncbi:hypothetical protein BGZ74_003243 [Mortierella antarctica]|nr:hypothetical protein BGZ74_003243 [Mortierella antarctica]